MKPPPFTYRAPRTTAEAAAALAEDERAKVLAGGQSLIPLLNMRMTSPATLVDIGTVTELDRVAVTAEAVEVGAGVRQAALERHREAMAACPLVGQALSWVAHPVVRNRGTVVGSIAHADPAAELPAVLRLLEGTVTVARAGEDGGVARREVPAEDFLLGPLESDVGRGELVESVRFPAMADDAGGAVVEVARRHGDYAVAGIVALVALDGGQLHGARVATISLDAVPQVVALDDLVGGRESDAVDWAGAGQRVRERVEPDGDLHATADYRRHLAGVLTERALTAALAHARSRHDTGAPSA